MAWSEFGWYYYNVVTMESAWELPKGQQVMTPTTAATKESKTQNEGWNTSQTYASKRKSLIGISKEKSAATNKETATRTNPQLSNDPTSPKWIEKQVIQQERSPQ